MGLLFGSAGAYTCPKSGQVPPPPHLGEQNFPTQTSNIFATLCHGILVFFQEFPSGGGGEAISIVFGPSFREGKNLRGRHKA